MLSLGYLDVLSCPKLCFEDPGLRASGRRSSRGARASGISHARRTPLTYHTPHTLSSSVEHYARHTMLSLAHVHAHTSTQRPSLCAAAAALSCCCCEASCSRLCAPAHLWAPSTPSSAHLAGIASGTSTYHISPRISSHSASRMHSVRVPLVCTRHGCARCKSRCTPDGCSQNASTGARVVESGYVRRSGDYKTRKCHLGCVEGRGTLACRSAGEVSVGDEGWVR